MLNVVILEWNAPFDTTPSAPMKLHLLFRFSCILVLARCHSPTSELSNLVKYFASFNLEWMNEGYFIYPMKENYRTTHSKDINKTQQIWRTGAPVSAAVQGATLNLNLDFLYSYIFPIPRCRHFPLSLDDSRGSFWNLACMKVIM